MPRGIQTSQVMRGRKPAGPAPTVHHVVQFLADTARNLGISRRRLANGAGVAISVPTAWYIGEQEPRIDTLEKVARSLGFTIVAMPVDARPPPSGQPAASPVTTPLVTAPETMPTEDMA